MSFAILRYPGGKGRFAGILAANVKESGCTTLIEPFAGGAAAGLTLLENETIIKLVLVELDPRVAKFWETIRDDKGFAQRVMDFEWAPKYPLLVQNAALEKRRQKLKEALTSLKKNDMGMWTLVKNRCSFGGYLNGGLLLKGFGKPTAAAAKRGDMGAGYQGVGSQWNRETLTKRIKKAHEWFKTGKIVFIRGNAFKHLREYPDCFAFVDAPYSCGADAPGKGLYDKHKVDHARLFEILKERKNWLATYNDSSEVRDLVSDGFEISKVKMSRLHADTDQRKEKSYGEIVITPKGQKFISKES